MVFKSSSLLELIFYLALTNDTEFVKIAFHSKSWLLSSDIYCKPIWAIVPLPQWLAFKFKKPVHGSGGGMLCQKYWKYWGDLSIISGKYWRALSIISGRLALALVGMRQCRLLCCLGEKIPSLYWNFSRLRIQILFQGGMHVAKSWEEKYTWKTFTSTHPTLSVAV